MKVSFKSNLSVVTRQILGNLDDAGAQLAADAVEWIQEQMLYGYHDPHGPDGHTEIYDTGALIESIAAEVKKDSQNVLTVTAGAPQHYAKYVHQGTYKLKARPFIRDALEKNRGKVEQVAADNLKKGF